MITNPTVTTTIGIARPAIGRSAGDLGALPGVLVVRDGGRPMCAGRRRLG